VNEGAAQGALATNIESLGKGIQALAQNWRRMAQHGDRGDSEFGRTFRENGNRGTDHGHGRLLAPRGSLSGGG